MSSVRADWLYNLADDERGIPRELAAGISSRVFVGDHAMISVVRIEPHSQGKVHSHPQEQWGFLIEGECIRIQGGEEVAAKAGDFWHTPGGVAHGIRTGDSAAVVIDVFSPPRDDYRTAGSGFGDA